MSDIDHEYTRNVVCPFCGYIDQDSWERHMRDGECDKSECGGCEKTFIVHCQVSVTYSTDKAAQP